MLFNRKPKTDLSKRAQTLSDVLGERKRISAGTVLTAETSIQRIAVFASANLIASVLSQLPVSVLRGEGSKKVEVEKTPLFVDPGGEGYGFEDWCWSVLFRCLVQGNAVGLIVDRDRYGFPTAIQLQELNTVRAVYDEDGAIQWTINNEKVPRDRIWHLRAYPQENSIPGLSPIAQHMRTIGIGLRAEDFGVQYFDDGAHPTAILTSAAKLDPTQASIVKSRFLAAVKGSREPVVLPNDIKYQAIQVNPLESQFLETQQYSATEVARIFGPGVPEMLGYETGGSMTYANVEQRSLHLLVYTLNPWLRRLESALSSPRMTPRGQYVKFNRGAMLQSTTMDRYKAYQIALAAKFQTVNEVRELEDWKPVDWGDEPNETAPPLPDKTVDDGSVSEGAKT